MAKQIVNIGAALNDGTGDQIRVAFDKVNDNADEIYDAGPVGTDIQIVGDTIQSTAANGDIVLTPSGTGTVDVSSRKITNMVNPDNPQDAVTKFYADNLISGANELDDLTDVEIVGQVNNDVLTYNGTSGNWEPVAPVAVASTLDDLTDVEVPAPNNNDVLTYNNTSGEWESVAPASVPSTLDSLTDVEVPTPADGEVLTYNNGTGDWESAAVPPGGLQNIIEDLTPQLGGDLDVNGNDIISLVGSVTITGPASTLTVPLDNGTTGEVLTTDGTGITSWDPVELPPATVDTVDAGDVNYDLQLDDAFSLIKTVSTVANTITIPLDATVNFDVGTEIDIIQYGTGATEITSEVGVTWNSYEFSSSSIPHQMLGQYSQVTLLKVAANEWVVYGATAP